jgi:hypothetical protein
LSLVFCCLSTLSTSAVHAEPSPSDHGRFNGSEFNASSFRDESLEKHSFRDLDDRTARASQSKQSEVHLGAAAKKKDKSVEASGGELRESSVKAVGLKGRFAESLQPHHEITGDWAPDKIDLTSNGGFSVEPFNGTPVPYTLNGHVDPNRGRPWEEH